MLLLAMRIYPLLLWSFLSPLIEAFSNTGDIELPKGITKADQIFCSPK